MKLQLLIIQRDCMSVIIESQRCEEIGYIDLQRAQID